MFIKKFLGVFNRKKAFITINMYYAMVNFKKVLLKLEFFAISRLTNLRINS